MRRQFRTWLPFYNRPDGPQIPASLNSYLKWYVYRLIDPRNGETFYVGKGKDDRIFAHIKGAIGSAIGEVSDPRIARIREIQVAGLEVSHVIHRHGLATPSAAYQVEAALIDAYPGLTNKVRGYGSVDYGSRHVEQIIAEFEAEEFEVREPLMFIHINKSYYTRPNPYEAVRSAWKINLNKARRYKLVLASLRGVVVGAYRPKKWLLSLKEHFPWEQSNLPDRWGFEGTDAEYEVWSYYVSKRVPARYKKKGAMASVRYCDPGIA